MAHLSDRVLTFEGFIQHRLPLVPLPRRAYDLWCSSAPPDAHLLVVPVSPVGLSPCVSSQGPKVQTHGGTRELLSRSTHHRSPGELTGAEGDGAMV